MYRKLYVFFVSNICRLALWSGREMGEAARFFFVNKIWTFFISGDKITLYGGCGYEYCGY